MLRRFLLSALLALSSCMPDAPPIEARRPTQASRAERVADLRRQFEDARAAWRAVYDSLSDSRNAKFATLHPPPNLEPWAEFLWELVDADPTDDATFDALKLVVERRRPGPDHERAIATLRAHHVENPRVAEFVSLLQIEASEPTEQFLVAVLERNPDRRTRGLACFTLAEERSRLLEVFFNLPDDLPGYVRDIVPLLAPEDRERMKATIERFAGFDPKVTRASSEALYQRAADEFGDVEFAGQTLRERVEGMRARTTELIVGKRAPEIEGTDLSGRPLKLSEFRGQVVLLDFWGDW